MFVINSDPLKLLLKSAIRKKCLGTESADPQTLSPPPPPLPSNSETDAPSNILQMLNAKFNRPCLLSSLFGMCNWYFVVSTITSFAKEPFATVPKILSQALLQLDAAFVTGGSCRQQFYIHKKWAVYKYSDFLTVR